MEHRIIRLMPGDDLLVSIEQLCHQEHIKAGCILSAVGSLNHATLRFANQSQNHFLTGKFEIVSLSGTISENGSHLHISLSDKNGNVIGGHLMPGCEVYTTAELIIGCLPELNFLREHCEKSGYRELFVASNKDS